MKHVNTRLKITIILTAVFIKKKYFTAYKVYSNLTSPPPNDPIQRFPSMSLSMELGAPDRLKSSYLKTTSGQPAIIIIQTLVRNPLVYRYHF